MTHASNSSEAYDPGNLLAGSKQPVTKTITIATSAALTAGALLGKITASGKYILSASAAADGSEVPDAILAHDADASAADVESVVYIEAEINQDEVTFGTGHTAASTAQGLRERGIHLRTIS